MRLIEGRGYLIRCGHDGPFAGWTGTRALECVAPTAPMAPWMALRALNEMAAILPGGLALLWDADPSWLQSLNGDQRTGFLEALSTLPGLSLHLRESSAAYFTGGAFRGWIHGPEMPTGSLGELWRHGAFGWVQDSLKAWSIPDLGHVPHGDTALLGALDEVVPGFLWGEVLFPLGALSSLDTEAIATSMETLQLELERAFSLRMSEGGWPLALPFQRRRCGWRVGVFGGAEYNGANGSWEEVETGLRDLIQSLESRLKSSVQVGPCHDLEAALLLGLQAMREGLPWRNSLALPPALPTFSAGLGADARTPSPLESRAAFPLQMKGLLQHPPVAMLRVPSVPSDEAAKALIARLPAIPALRWLPPELPLPGPFSPEHPWAPATDFPFPSDPTAGVQLGLFGEWE